MITLARFLLDDDDTNGINYLNPQNVPDQRQTYPNPTEYPIN